MRKKTAYIHVEFFNAEHYFILCTGKANDLTNQLKAAKQNAESAKQELADYKEKAARILQVILLYSFIIGLFKF